jgi:hypothetical protein
MRALVVLVVRETHHVLELSKEHALASARLQLQRIAVNTLVTHTAILLASYYEIHVYLSTGAACLRQTVARLANCHHKRFICEFIQLLAKLP